MQGAGPDRPLSPRDRHLPLFPGAQDLVIRRLDRFCYSASRRFQRRRWRRKSQSKNKATTRMAMLSLCVTEYIEAGRRAFDSVPLPNFPPMVAVAVCFFVVGAVLGAWILHLLGPVVHTVHFHSPSRRPFPFIHWSVAVPAASACAASVPAAYYTGSGISTSRRKVPHRAFRRRPCPLTGHALEIGLVLSSSWIPN